MSGRLQLRDALEAQSTQVARRHKSVRRGNVTKLNPLTVELQDYDLPLVEDEDFVLSQWAEVYRTSVKFALGDVVLMHMEENDWTLTDVISDTVPGKIGSGGSTTPPPPPPPKIVAARGHRRAALTVGSWTDIPLDGGPDYDVSGNLFDAVNGRFVCPVAGVYDVSASVLFNVSATGTYTFVACGIAKNGTIVAQNFSGPAIESYGCASISDQVKCDAGDYLTLRGFNGQTAALDLDPSMNFMAVALITAGQGPPGPIGPPGSLGIQPAAKIYRSATVAIPLNVVTIVPFDVIGLVQGSMALAPNGGFIVPSAGIYRMTSNILWNADTTGGRIDHFICNYTQGGMPSDASVAGGGAVIYNRTAGAFGSSQLTALIQANASDVLCVGVINRGTDVINAYAGNNWTMAECIRVSS